MSNPVKSALKGSGFPSMRALATKLLELNAPLFRGLSADARSLEPRLRKLDLGVQLQWWRDRREAAAAVAKELGIDVRALNLDVSPIKHQFGFHMFPQLPALDLAVEDRYSIARPALVVDDERIPPAWKNLEYWFFGEGTNPSPQHLDWLQVDDRTEFDLIAAHLTAASRHAVCPVDVPAQAGGEDAEALKHRSPLILIVHRRVGAAEVGVLRKRAQMAPLLVISRYSLPEPSVAGVAAGMFPRDKGGEIYAWRWVLNADWRQTLLEWVAKRLTDREVRSMLDPVSLGQWLLRVDPDCAWFPHTEDILQICRVFLTEPAQTLRDVEIYQGGLLLLGRLFGIESSVLKNMETMVKSRWRDWGASWDSELDAAGWIRAGIGQKPFDAFVQSGMIARGENGYSFANGVVARLLLRRALERQVSTEDPSMWWQGCFDGGRRPLIDNTLGTMPMSRLASAARRQRRPTGEEEHLAGTAEALFLAIGKRLAAGVELRKEMRVVGEIVFRHWLQAPDTNRPWSRPLNSLEQSFEWISAMWAWSLHSSAPSEIAGNWLVPGWSVDLPEKLPAWLNPRASFNAREWPVPQGATLDAFMDVTRLVVGKRKAPLPGYAPALLKPALLWRAATGAWEADPMWWLGLIGVDWAEHALVAMLDEEDPRCRHVCAKNLWPSLVHCQRTQRESRRMEFGRSKDLQLPSCRPDAQRFSPVLAWTANHLLDADILDLLKSDEDLRFLEDHPQWLLTQHKLQVLDALSKRLPLPLSLFESPNYFSPFLPDAAEGLVSFLHDEELGAEAARGVWNCLPDLALDLLSGSECNVEASTNLLLTSSSAHLQVVLSALERFPDLLPPDRKQQWVQYRLPTAGQYAKALFAILRS